MIEYSGRKVSLMGIVNLTPDSFFASSRTLSDGRGLYRPDLKDAFYRIEKHLSDGADIIDIGACSTRPGSEPVPPEEEWGRLEGVLSVFRREFGDVPLSVDTFRVDIARRAMEFAGPIIINDVSGSEMDGMLALAAKNGLQYVATHNVGAAGVSATYPEGVVEAVRRYFVEFADKASAAGVSDWILDPGLGFGKTAAQNWELLSQCSSLSAFGKPVLIGYSRKRMIYEPIGLTAADLNTGLTGENLRRFEEQSLRAFEMALEQGASIIRLHEVDSVSKTPRFW